jgi:hypothetical protein
MSIGWNWCVPVRSAVEYGDTREAWGKAIWPGVRQVRNIRARGLLMGRTG